MKPGMPHRAKVFCVNWGHAAPVTRYIVHVYDKHDRLVASPHFGTLAEAIAYVLIEQNPEYLPLINYRLNQPLQTSLLA